MSSGDSGRRMGGDSRSLVCTSTLQEHDLLMEWKKRANRQMKRFPCSDQTTEAYDLSMTLKDSDELWRVLSSEVDKYGKSEADKYGNSSVISLDNQCARRGTASADAKVYLRASSTDVDVYLQIFKRHFLKLLYPLVDSEVKIEYILDGGANCGMTTVLLASMFPSATIVSVEPDPANFRVLRKNAGHLNNVHLVQAGLWDVTGKIVLKSSHGQWGQVFKRVEEDDDGDGDGLQAYSVADILEQFDIPRFDLVKMDIEGSEAVVLGGKGDMTWLEDVKVFFAEVHDMFAGYFGLSEELQEVTEIVERAVGGWMDGPTRVMDNEHTLYFGSSVWTAMREE